MVRIVGFSSLAIILIGLVVTWIGYVKSVPWAWFIMFIIVWVWAFPGLVLPFFSPGIAVPWRQGVSDTVNHPGIARDFFEGIATFLLLAIALLLPIGSFFRRGKSTSGAGDPP
jgi:hypothetical protein